MDRAALWLAAALVAGCGGESDDVAGPTTGDPGGGEAGHMEVLPPDVGPRAFACAPGELEQDDGSCAAAGVLDCGQGFVASGDGGCEAVLPATPCGPGMMALPGETSCRPVSACGVGPWDGIAVGPDTEHVDVDYGGGGSDGSASAPWTTIQEAIDAAAAGAVVAVAPGTYAEALAIAGKAVHLWGKCPGEVEIEVSSIGVHVQAGAEGSVIEGVAIRGTGTGVLVEDAGEVVIARTWLHDLTWIGVYAHAPLAVDPPSVEIQGVLIEAATSAGIYDLGGMFLVEDTVVRGIATTSNGTDGYGIEVQNDLARGFRPELTLRRAVIEDNRWAGLRLLAGSVLVEDSLIRDTLPEAEYAYHGAGIYAEASYDLGETAYVEARRVVIENSNECAICVFRADALVEDCTLRGVARAPLDGSGTGIFLLADPERTNRPSLTLRRSLIADIDTFGLGVSGGDAVIEGLLLREVHGGLDFPISGLGITIEAVFSSGQRSTGVIRGSRIEDTRTFGILVMGSDAEIEGVAVRGVRSNPHTQAFGRGIGVEAELSSLERSGATIVNSLVEDVQEVGIDVLGGDVTLDSTSVRDVVPSDTGLFGIGILVQITLETFQRSSADIRWSEVDNTTLSGITIAGADADIANTAVRGTRPHPVLADFGDGIVGSLFVYVTQGTSEPTHLALSEVLVDGNTRTGISSFGADVEVGGSWLACNPIALNGEPFQGFDFVFDDLGENTCTCDGETELCKVLSSNLRAPPLL